VIPEKGLAKNALPAACKDCVSVVEYMHLDWALKLGAEWL
jgi:hypothetical protein